MPSTTEINLLLPELSDFHKSPEYFEKIEQKLLPKAGTDCFFSGGWQVEKIDIIENYYEPIPIKASAS